MTGRALLAPLARGYVGARTRAWPSHSRLFAVGERTTWSVDEDARHLEATARRLRYDIGASRWARFATDQAVFLTSHFEALQPRWMQSTHRLATAYLHGRPGTPGYPEFDRAYDALRSAPERVSRIQVTHEEMRELVLEAGVEPSAVHVIAIGIDIEQFPLVTPEHRDAARAAFDLPADAFVVGSFQKDGVGWDEGLEPKLVKGPDVLVAALERVAAEISEVHVLLTGPARGYVRSELERRGIAYRHTVAQSRRELATAYHALDAYVVASRQEGGPKGVLEALAAGVPLVSTRVGQAPSIVRDGETGLLVDVYGVEAIAAAVLHLHNDSGLRESFRAPGRTTAEQYAYERLDPSWAGLLEGFVERHA